MSADLGLARTFSTALAGAPGARVTFQTFDDKGKRTDLAHILHGTLDQHAVELERLNGEGAGVFVCVNETDLAGRKAENVVAVRSYFADFDEGDPVKPWHLPPSLIVGSKNGPHVYWLAKPGQDLLRFTEAQKRLAAFYGSDPKVCDTSRVMRLPGFDHRKGDPFRVQMMQADTGVRYDLADLLADIPELPEVTPTRTPTTGTTVQLVERLRRASAYLDRIPGAVEGENGSSQTFITALKIGVGFDLPHDVALDLLRSWNKRCSPPWDDVDLERKLTEAETKSDAGRGWLLNERETGNDARDADDAAPAPDDEDEGRPSCASELIKIGRGADLFSDERGDGYAAFTDGPVRQILRIRGSRLTQELTRRYSEAHDFRRAANGEAVASARNVLEGLALHKGERRKLWTRFARHEGDIFVDLADAGWRAVRIGETGWKVEETPPILFRRYPHQQPLPVPKSGGDIAGLLAPFNMSAGERAIILAFIVAAFVPDINRPILLPNGPQGSGKSTLCKWILALLDPSGAEDLGLGSEENALAQSLDAHQVAFFDNVVKVTDWQAKVLCKAVTGGGLEKRRLYSDDDSIILALHNVIILNGINVPTSAPDFLDRTILLSMDRIPPERRKTDLELQTVFNRMKPLLFGAMLDTVVKAMRIRPTLNLASLPRMADFASWGAAVAEALDLRLEDGTRGAAAFLGAYRLNVGRQTEEVLEADPVARAIRALVAEKGAWTGTKSGLLALLKERHPDDAKTEGWPKRADGLGRRIKVLQATLADVGISVREDRTAGERVVTLAAVESGKLASLASSRHKPSAGAGSGHDATVTPNDGNRKPRVIPNPAAGTGYDADDANDASFPYSTAAVPVPDLWEEVA